MRGARLFKEQLEDFAARKSRPLVAAAATEAARVLASLRRPEKALSLAMLAHRLNYGSVSLRLIKSSALFQSGEYRNLVSSGVTLDEASRRSIVLRWPQFRDGKLIHKGVLLVKFTRVFSFYLRETRLREFSSYFSFVLEPSYAGYSDPDILLWDKLCKGPVYVQASELRDRIFINTVAERLVPVSFGASDWADHRSFRPIANGDKRADSLYVANTGRYKRVFRYLLAVRNLVSAGCQDYCGHLVCARWGGREQEIRSLVDALGLSDNIRLDFNLDKEALNRAVNEAKVSVLLSYKEGANKTLFESMFADTPVILISENIGVNKSYINEFTGVLVQDGELERALLTMRTKWKYFRPRSWALENISPEVTTRKLASLLAIREQGGQPLTEPLLVKCNSPEARYFHYPELDTTPLTKRLLELFSGLHVGEVEQELMVLRDRFWKLAAGHAGAALIEGEQLKDAK